MATGGTYGRERVTLRHCIKRHQNGSASITAFATESAQRVRCASHNSVERMYWLPPSRLGE